MTFQTPPNSHAKRAASSFPVLAAQRKLDHFTCSRFKMAAAASDAASMLAEALQKMDGLISDDQLIMESLKSQYHGHVTTNNRILCQVEELRTHVEELPIDTRAAIEVPESTVALLIDWLRSMQVNKLITLFADNLPLFLLAKLLTKCLFVCLFLTFIFNSSCRQPSKVNDIKASL